MQDLDSSRCLQYGVQRKPITNTKQDFIELFSGGSGTLTVDGTEYETLIMTYTPNGDASGSLVVVANLGCEESDFPAGVEGQIALISRGECNFAQKVLNAGTAGAAAALVYNNVEGTLGRCSLRPESV